MLKFASDSAVKIKMKANSKYSNKCAIVFFDPLLVVLYFTFKKLIELTKTQLTITQDYSQEYKQNHIEKS